MTQLTLVPPPPITHRVESGEHPGMDAAEALDLIAEIAARQRPDDSPPKTARRP